MAGTSKATWGSPVQAYTSGTDAFVAKLNSSGALQWNTFLGGSGDDSGNAIAVDGSGNVYVAGYSIATWGSPVQAFTGSYSDAFAAKLNSSGALQWNTFLGPAAEGNAIAVDESGNVYVAGASGATWGSPVRAYTRGDDAFAAKLNSSGALQWNTFLGGSGIDVGHAIAVDGSGNVYVTGDSEATWGSPVQAHMSGLDAFAVKLNSNGVLQWNTFLGGISDDVGTAIAVDASGNVYVAGYSVATWGALPVRAYSGQFDAFAAKLNSSGVLQWNTFLGGRESDEGNAIAVDTSGNVYMAGFSNATWGSPVRAFSGTKNAFAAKLNSNGALQWNTFLGGLGADVGNAIAVDTSENVYVAGTTSYDTWGSPVRAYTSGGDAFVAKLSDLTPTNAPSITPTNTPGNTLTNTPSTTPTNTPSTTPTNTPPDFLTGNAWIFALCCCLIALGGLVVAGIIVFVWQRRKSSSTKRAPVNQVV